MKNILIITMVLFISCGTKDTSEADVKEQKEIDSLNALTEKYEMQSDSIKKAYERIDLFLDRVGKLVDAGYSYDQAVEKVKDITPEDYELYLKAQ